MVKLPAWLAAFIARKGLESLPLPSRGQTWGRTPSWAGMLAQVMNQPQPIRPEDANNGTDSSVVSICIHWIATSWQVAIPRVGVQADESPDSFVPELKHPLLELLRNPSPDTDGVTFHWALITDYIRFGNAYAHKVRGNLGRPVRLEWLPARYMAPIPDEKTGRLKEYRYQPSGASEAFPIPMEDVLHIKHGLDEFFPLQGVSPLAAQYREIVTDNKYSDYAAGLARNAGMSPAVLTPRETKDTLGGAVGLSRDDAEYLSKLLSEKMKSDPGGLRILPASLDLHSLGYSPDEMALLDVRAMPETRIPAALGLPALLLQLYTGVQRSTFANLDAAIKQGWRGCIIPMQAVFASAITRQLLPDFEGKNPKDQAFRYDYSLVPELQDDEIALRAADREDVKAGILTPDEARERQGLGKLPTPATPPPAQTPLLVDPAAKSLRLKRDVPFSPGADIYEVADAFRRALEADERAAMDEVARAWNQSRRAMDTHLAAVLESLKGLDALEGAERQERLRALAEQMAARMESIEGILSDLADRGAAITESGQRAALATTTSATPSLAQAMAGTGPAGSPLPWNALTPDSFEVLVGLSSDGSPLSALLATFGADTGEAIRQGLLDAVTLGENPRQAAARLSALQGTARARLETIARTEMLRASREASRRTYRANSDVLDGYIRLSAADADTCVSCWAFHGTKSESSEIMPTHPNCRCALVPAVKSWAEILQDDSLPDTRPVIESGPALFAALPEKTQAQVLGPSRLALYQSGTPLSEMTETQGSEWGPTTRIKPLSEVSV